MVKVIKTKLDFFSPICVVDLEIGNDISVPESSFWDYEKGDIVVCGFLFGNQIIQLVHEHDGDTEEFKKLVKGLLDERKNSLHSFNYRFEQGVLKGLLGKSVYITEIKPFRGRNWTKDRFFQELITDGKVESNVVPSDPLNGDGRLVPEKWSEGKIDEILAHNTNCLIKEHFIFLNREYLLNKYKNQLDDRGWIRQ